VHAIESKIILDQESPILKNKYDGSLSSFELNSFLDIYIISCAQSLGAITSAINKASLSINMLNKNLLSHIDTHEEALSTHIEMLIENSIIRVQSIYDRVLIFINKILNLGISNECVKHNTLVTNEHVITFKLESKLKAINKACNEYRLMRNTVIHHNRYSEEEFDKIQIIIEAHRLSKQVNGNNFIEPQEMSLILDDFLNITQTDLQGYLDKITQKIYELFDDISTIYDYQKNKLRE
jgi:hypothetical protein